MARHRLTPARKKVSGLRTMKRTTRKHRISGTGKIETVLMHGVAGGLGAIAANELGVVAGNFITSLKTSPKTLGIAQFAIGIGAIMLSKSEFIQMAGIGAAGIGMYNTVKGFGIISGPDVMSYQYKKVGADPRLQFVAGPTTRIGAGVGSPPNPIPVVAGVHRRKTYVS